MCVVAAAGSNQIPLARLLFTIKKQKNTHTPPHWEAQQYRDSSPKHNTRRNCCFFKFRQLKEKNGQSSGEGLSVNPLTPDTHSLTHKEKESSRKNCWKQGKMADCWRRCGDEKKVDSSSTAHKFSSFIWLCVLILRLEKRAGYVCVCVWFLRAAPHAVVSHCVCVLSFVCVRREELSATTIERDGELEPAQPKLAN